MKFLFCVIFLNTLNPSFLVFKAFSIPDKTNIEKNAVIFCVSFTNTLGNKSTFKKSIPSIVVQIPVHSIDIPIDFDIAACRP